MAVLQGAETLTQVKIARFHQQLSERLLQKR